MDVTHCDFKTTRTTNPLMPSYTIRDEDNKVTSIGEVKGSSPNVLPPARKDENFLATSLKTSDIHGCAPSTWGLGNFHTRIRKTVKHTNST